MRELRAVVESAVLILPGRHEVDADLLRLASGDSSDEMASTGHVNPSAGPLDAALDELDLRLVRVGLIKKLTRLGLR